MLLALLDKPVQPEDVQQKRSRPEEHQRNSCILWKTGGHRVGRSSTSSNKKNFWAVLEMMDKRHDTLREHLESGRKNAQYTSRIILNKMIEVVVEYIRKEHTRSLEDENAFFSIMANEVTDPHGNQILSVCLKMLAHCKVKQFIFYLMYIERATGESIAQGVVECL